MKTLIDALKYLEIYEVIEHNYRQIWGESESLDKEFLNFRLFKGKNNEIRGAMRTAGKRSEAANLGVDTWLYDDTVAAVAKKLEENVLKDNLTFRELLYNTELHGGGPVVELRVVKYGETQWKVTIRRAFYIDKTRTAYRNIVDITIPLTAAE